MIYDSTLDTERLVVDSQKSKHHVINKFLALTVYGKEREILMGIYETPRATDVIIHCTSVHPKTRQKIS